MNFIRPRQKTVPFHGCITFMGRELIVKADILPGRKWPHVSIDSPDYGKAEPAEILTYSLYSEDGLRDEANKYFHYREQIRALIMEAWKMEQAREMAEAAR